MIPTAVVDSATLDRAMRRALELAATPGVPLGPNPRVGCVLLGPDYAGKTAAMSALNKSMNAHVVSYDDVFLGCADEVVVPRCTNERGGVTVTLRSECVRRRG